MKVLYLFFAVIVVCQAIGFSEKEDPAVIAYIELENPLPIVRAAETIEIDLQAISTMVKPEDLVVYDPLLKVDCLTQLLDADGDSNVETLLFQVKLDSLQKKTVLLKKRLTRTVQSEIMTFGRFVPERMDDFAWENDMIAFRMYGPALWDDAVNSGIDCWLKRVPYPIVDKWYGQMSEKTYHTDWGEGYDPYHVGKTAGCGGLRIIENGRYLHSNVYDRWKVIANGPIRSIFELSYDKSWKDSGKNLTETKRMTIDLGQRLCRFDCRFSGEDSSQIEQFAVGVTTHDGKAKAYQDIEATAYCWEKIDGQGLGSAAIVAFPAVKSLSIVEGKKKDEGHIYLITDKVAEPTITYYVGYGWEKAGQITTPKSWSAYLQNFKDRIDHPVRVSKISVGSSVVKKQEN